MTFLKYLLLISLLVNLYYLLTYIVVNYEFPITIKQNLRGLEQTNQIVQNILIGKTNIQTDVDDDTDDEINNKWSEKYNKLDKEWGNNYENLRLKYNELIDNLHKKNIVYEELRIKYNKMIEKQQLDYNNYEELRNKYNNLVQQYNTIPKPKGYITTATGVRYGVY